MPQPTLKILLQRDDRVFAPGDELAGEFQLVGVADDGVEAVEISVLWYTEGTGDEDLGVHYFRRETAKGQPLPLDETRRFHTRLPNSPLSYEGVIVKVRWCARVRVFFHGGRQLVSERCFSLGQVPPGREQATRPDQS